MAHPPTRFARKRPSRMKSTHLQDGCGPVLAAKPARGTRLQDKVPAPTLTPGALGAKPSLRHLALMGVRVPSGPHWAAHQKQAATMVQRSKATIEAALRDQPELFALDGNRAADGKGAPTETPAARKTARRTKRKSAATMVRVVAPSEALQGRPLKKHVAAIHTDGHLSLLQRKLSNVLLLNAYDALLTRQEHEIDEKTLCVMLGYDSNDRKPLKGALKALASVHAEWNILGDNQEEVEWGVSSLLSHAVLSKGRCRYGYSPALAEKLYNPAIYASINMSVQRKFRSGYALALYENCYRFKNVGSTGWWTVQTFRRLLGVGESDYYRQFKHLNAKIIKPTVAEINKVSDIRITPEFRRKGRSVADIRFKIAANAQMPLIDIDDEGALKGSTTYARLKAAGISHRLAQSWIQTHGEDYVAAKLDLVDTNAKTGKVASIAGYLATAIRDDYQPPEGQGGRPSDPEVAARAAALTAEREARANEARAEQKRAEARVRAEKDAAIDRAERARDWLSRKAASERDALLARFEPTLDKAFLKSDFKRGGLQSLSVAIRFADFVDLDG